MEGTIFEFAFQFSPVFSFMLSVVSIVSVVRLLCIKSVRELLRDAVSSVMYYFATTKKRFTNVKRISDLRYVLSGISDVDEYYSIAITNRYMILPLDWAISPTGDIDLKGIAKVLSHCGDCPSRYTVYYYQSSRSCRVGAVDLVFDGCVLAPADAHIRDQVIFGILPHSVWSSVLVDDTSNRADQCD